MIIKTLNKLILNMYNLSITFIVDNLFSLLIKQFQKVISIPLFLQIYNFIISFYDFLLILFFFLNVVYSSNYYFYALYFPNFFWYI